MESKTLETINVGVKLCPHSPSDQTSKSIIEIINDNKIIASHPESGQGLLYKFDFVFDESCSVNEIYDQIGSIYIDKLLEGYNVCFMSYGPSRTGKTKLFFGENDHNHNHQDNQEGLILLSMKDCFSKIKNNNKSYEILMSNWEMNNNEIIDLLQPYKRTFKIINNEENEKEIQNMSIVNVESYEEFKMILENGFLNSQKLAEKRSLRWHNMLKITFIINDTEHPEKTIKSKLFFVNLKGTEKFGKEGARGKMLKQGGNLNKSVTALCNTIHNIVSYIRNRFKVKNIQKEEIVNEFDDAKKVETFEDIVGKLPNELHSMFGDSKLTTLLSNVFAGSYYTTIICSISHSEKRYLETMDSLENLRISNHIPVFPKITYLKTRESELFEQIGYIEQSLPEDKLAPGHPLTEEQEELERLRAEFNQLINKEEEEGYQDVYFEKANHGEMKLPDDSDARLWKRNEILSCKHGDRKTYFHPKNKEKEESQENWARKKKTKTKKKEKEYKYTYRGQWKGNLKDGYGILHTKEYIYEGNWKNNKKDGVLGMLWIKEKNKKTKEIVLRRVYKGSWKNDKKDGTGVYFYENGEIYVGEWKNDKRHGSGIMYTNDKKKHTGQYEGDMKNGLGIIKDYKTGDFYKGYFCNDKKNGPGLYVKKLKGTIYKGEWVDGTPKCGEISFLKDLLPGKEEDTVIKEVLPIPVIGLDNRLDVLEKSIARIRKSGKLLSYDKEIDFNKDYYKELEKDLLFELEE